jgi:hypothetical protein
MDMKGMLRQLGRVGGPIGRLPFVRLRSVRTAAGLTILAVVGTGIGVGIRQGVDASHHAPAKKSSFSLPLADSGQVGAANGNGGANSGGSNGSSSSAGGSGPQSGTPQPGSSHGAKPTPKGTFVMPTPWDEIDATPQLRLSNCFNYPRNVQCKVYVSGAYELVSQAAGKVVIEVLIDHNVAASQTIAPAPAGGHRFGWTMQFTVPNGSHEIDYEAFLQDAQGKQLADSGLFQTHT